MADLSKGNEDKSVTKTSSFKIFGKSPARTLSSKKSANPLMKMFSRSRKLDKKTDGSEYADESDPSNTIEADTEVIGETAPATLLEKLTEDAPKFIEEVVSTYANKTENLASELTKAIPVAESKESTPAEEKKKPEFFSKIKNGAEKAKEELQSKAKEELKKVEGGLTEAYKAFTSTYNKATTIEQQPIDDKKLQDVKEVKTDEAANVPVPLSSPTPTGLDHQDDNVVAATRAAEPTKTEATTTTTTTEAASQPGDNPENKQEVNCFTYLAEELQKVCATWNNNNKKEE
ncbi:uncharacterized protein LOC110712908 isoform X2 [Chenopodium quinoa]|uniref:uncharacterized protein LOC110712908 isoform X2 n=1 Tax=Chenopodium quinoa TaxID=63459 RepID=UPI000B794E3E|nr:uncharacterized protein LOC110712908 isoform X2 [Chenopodium quinoa]